MWQGHTHMDKENLAGHQIYVTLAPSGQTSTLPAHAVFCQNNGQPWGGGGKQKITLKRSRCSGLGKFCLE